MTPEEAVRIREAEVEVAPKRRVRVECLYPTIGWMISEEALFRRRAGVEGTLLHYVPGHGGDVWGVVHDGTGTYVDGSGRECWDKSGVAPYGLGEIVVLDEPTEPSVR